MLAIVVEGLSRFLPIPKSLPMDKYFHDAPSAYLMAAFGIPSHHCWKNYSFAALLYPLLRRAFGLAIAVALTAAAFAAIHGAQLGYAWAPILSIFVVGVVLTMVRAYQFRRRLFPHTLRLQLCPVCMLWIASDHFRHLEKWPAII